MPRLTNGLEQVLTNLGIVGSGYKLFFFETGTTTLKSTYSDEALTIANTNPIVLNSAGRPSIDVWGSDPTLYRMILGTPGSVVGNITTIVDVDPVDNYQVDNIANLNPIPTAYWGTTAGTSTAYTLEEPLVDISSYSNTQTFFIDIHVACGDSPTFKVKDLPAITLTKYLTNGTTTDLVSGDLQIQRYLCINNGTNIVVLNPRYPENLDATTEKKGLNYLPKQIKISNGADTDHDLNFSAGNAQADDGSIVFSVEALTKRIDASWVAGTDQGGLDTGTVANDTPYYCYAIYNPTTLISDILFTATKGSPTMPSGYIEKYYIGSCHTNGSANIRNGTWVFGNNGYNFEYKDGILEFQKQLTTSYVNENVSIPNGCFGRFQVFMTSTTSPPGFIQMFVKSTSMNSVTLSTGASANLNFTGGSEIVRYCPSGQVSVKVDVIGSSGHTASLESIGWQEYL